MDYVQPYGVDDLDAPYIDGDRLAGITGSRPRAASYEMLLRELRNLVVVAGADQPDKDDWTQVAAAVIAMHRVTEAETLYVPGNFSTLHECMRSLSDKIIPSDVFVTVQVEEDQQIDPATGPMVLNHPYGSQITIKGKPLTASFPVYTYTPGGLNNDTYRYSAAATENFLRTIWPTRIVVTGAVNAIYMSGGTIAGVENLLFIGDRSAGQHGILIGDYVGRIGTGNIRLNQCAFHNMGYDGVRANFGANVQATLVCATHCGSNGFRIANKSAMQTTGSVLACFNSYDGITITDASFFEVFTGTSDTHKNGANGIGCDCGSNLQTTGATIVRGAQNGAYGILIGNGATAIIKAPSLAGNALYDICAQRGSMSVEVYGVPFEMPTMSPAANTLGNVQSYIYQH